MVLQNVCAYARVCVRVGVCKRIHTNTFVVGVAELLSQESSSRYGRKRRKVMGNVTEDNVTVRNWEALPVHSPGKGRINTVSENTGTWQRPTDEICLMSPWHA